MLNRYNKGILRNWKLMEDIYSEDKWWQYSDANHFITLRNVSDDLWNAHYFHNGHVFLDIDIPLKHDINVRGIVQHIAEMLTANMSTAFFFELLNIRVNRSEPQ